MKKIRFSVLPAFAIALVVLPLFNDTLPIGAPLPNPDLKMKDISGKEVSFNDAARKNGLLVMFSCNTCPYVIKNQRRTREVCSYAQANDIGVVVLNSNEANRGDEDSYAAMKEYASGQQYNWYYLVDKNAVMADAFGAKRTPECYLFDKNNKLVYRGAIDDNPSDPGAVSRKHLVNAMDEMKAGKDVSVKESRSVGCSIKRIG